MIYGLKYKIPDKISTNCAIFIGVSCIHFMFKKIIIVILFFSFGLTDIKSQDPNTWCGVVFDSISSEPLVGATIAIPGGNQGIITNEEGKFCLSGIENTHKIAVSYIGYKTKILPVSQVDKKGIFLVPDNYKFKEIVISHQGGTQNLERHESEVVLTAKESALLPALLGEADILRGLKLTGGVQTSSDADAGIYVRGGGTDQNLILLDKAPVYNPSHVMGLFSVFNNEVLQYAKLIKAGSEASQGGRLSSVFDIRTKNGDFYKHSGYANMGLISSNIKFDGPLVQNKLSYQVAGRISYVDELVKPVLSLFLDKNQVFIKDSKYRFYDVNGKLSYKSGDNDFISLTLYNGADFFRISKGQDEFDNRFSWGNQLLALNWNHVFSSRSYLYNTLSYSNYVFDFAVAQNNVDIDLFSGIEDMSHKLEWIWYANTKLSTSIGTEYHYRHFTPNNLDVEINTSSLDMGPNRNLYSHEITAFANANMELTPQLSLNGGVRTTAYLQEGPYTIQAENASGIVYDSIAFKKGEKVTYYFNPEYRFSVRYLVMDNLALKLFASRHYQYVHLATNSTVTLPMDVWLPSTIRLKPQWGDQYAAGIFTDLLNGSFQGSIEAYYKNMHNQLELLNGIINNFRDNIFENSIAVGKSESKGIEFTLKKNNGKLTGWLVYTLSDTKRKFDEINNGLWYPAKYDRLHDGNLVLHYKATEKISFSTTFIYATGNAFTIPEYIYLINGNVINGYGQTNGFRLPPYHRLDLGVSYILKKTQRLESILNFSVFNAYNRSNPYYIYFEVSGNIYKDYKLEVTPRQVTIFPILPSINWTVYF